MKFAGNRVLNLRKRIKNTGYRKKQNNESEMNFAERRNQRINKNNKNSFEIYEEKTRKTKTRKF